MAAPVAEVKAPAPPAVVINYAAMTDEEVLGLVKAKKLPAHNLEKYLPQLRAVHIRRMLLNEHLIAVDNNLSSLNLLPYEHYDYSLVTNQCCENVIGYVQVPVGYAGPIRVDGKQYYVPLATTEGALLSLCVERIHTASFLQVPSSPVRTEVVRQRAWRRTVSKRSSSTTV